MTREKAVLPLAVRTEKTMSDEKKRLGGNAEPFH